LLSFPRITVSYVPNFIDFLGRNALLFFVLWTFFRAAHHLILGPYSFLPLNDEGDLSVPRQLAGIGEYFSMPRSFWSPNLVGGSDSLASMQDPNIDGVLYVLFPTWLAFGLSVWITIFVTSYLLFKLLKDHLQCPLWVSLGCALSIFPVYPMYPQPQPLAVLVLTLWAVPWALNNLRLGLVAFVALGALIGASSGYAYAIFHLPALAVCMFALWPSVRTIFLILAVVVGYLLYDGTAIASAVLNAPLSNRTNLGAEGSWQLNLSSFWADLRNWGWICILAGAAALLSENSAKRLWLLTVAAAVIIATPVIAYLAVSLLANEAVLGQAIRTHIGMPLMAGVAVALALPEIVVRLNRLLPFKLEHPLIALGALALLTTAVLEKIGGGAGWRPRGTNFSSAYNHPDLHSLRQHTLKFPPFRVATVEGTRTAFRQETMFPVTYGFEMTDGYINLYSKRSYEYWRAATAGVQGMLSKYLGYEFDGGQMLALFGLKDGLRAMCKPNTVVECRLPFDKFYNLDMLSLANTKYLISPVSIEAKGLKLLPSASRANLLEREKKKRPKKLNALLKGTYNADHVLYIYENMRVLPRAFIVNDIQVFENGSAVLKALSTATVKSLSTMAYVARSDLIEAGLAVGDLPASRTSGYKTGSFHIYENDRLVIDAETETRGILVITNNYSPFWEACVNGKSSRVFPIYHTFQGLIIEPGKSRIELVYNPPYRFGGSNSCGG